LGRQGKKKGRGKRARERGAQRRRVGFLFYFKKYVSSLILKLVLKTTYKPHQYKCSFNLKFDKHLK
jgi:hypothetical protein